jgi:hypothetical protein
MAIGARAEPGVLVRGGQADLVQPIDLFGVGDPIAPDFREAQDAAKYERCVDFGHALPALRKRVEADLKIGARAEPGVLVRGGQADLVQPIDLFGVGDPIALGRRAASNIAITPISARHRTPPNMSVASISAMRSPPGQNQASLYAGGRPILFSRSISSASVIRSPLVVQ